MDAKEFVSSWRREKENLLHIFTSNSSESNIPEKIKSLSLNKKQEATLIEILENTLNDTFYTLLLGLDGSASIGGVQQSFKIYDGNNNLISSYGEMEAEAFEQFQNG